MKFVARAESIWTRCESRGHLHGMVRGAGKSHPEGVGIWGHQFFMRGFVYSPTGMEVFLGGWWVDSSDNNSIEPSSYVGIVIF